MSRWEREKQIFIRDKDNDGYLWALLNNPEKFIDWYYDSGLRYSSPYEPAYLAHVIKDEWKRRGDYNTDPIFNLVQRAKDVVFRPSTDIEMQDYKKDWHTYIKKNNPTIKKWVNSEDGKYWIDTYTLPSWLSLFGGSFNRGYNMPGTNYVGPSSKIDPKYKPLTLLDKIAYNHDIAYSKAKTQKDIQKADEIMLSDLNKTLASEKNYYSIIQMLIAKSGIWTKSKFEKMFGVQYPGSLPADAVKQEVKKPIKADENKKTDQKPILKQEEMSEDKKDVKTQAPKPLTKGEDNQIGVKSGGGVLTGGQRGSYHGTGEEQDAKMYKYKEILPIHTRNTGQMSFHWGNKLRGTTMGSNWLKEGQYDDNWGHDQIIANCFTPMMNQFIDDRLMQFIYKDNNDASLRQGIYNRFKLKSFTLKGVFKNIPCSLWEQSSHFAKYVNNKNDTSLMHFCKFQSPGATEKGVWQWWESDTYNIWPNTSKYGTDNTLNSITVNQMIKVPDNNFIIVRDYEGKLVDDSDDITLSVSFILFIHFRTNG